MKTKSEFHATAIPTEYEGVKFKSRLEAQCAFLFDQLEWDWEYEPRSFMLPNGISYTPDFFIESCATFWECRGYDTKKGELQIAGFAQVMASGGVESDESSECNHTRFVVLRGDTEASTYEETRHAGTVALTHCVDCGWRICPPDTHESQWGMVPLAIFCESCQAPMDLRSWRRWDGRTRIDRLAVVTAAAGKVL